MVKIKAVRRHYTMISLLLIQADCNMDVLDIVRILIHFNAI